MQQPLTISRVRWSVSLLRPSSQPAIGGDPPPPKRVLMLYGHDPNAPGVVAFTNELHAIVQAESPTRVVFYDELLDLERFPENERREELVDYIVEKYRGFRFDAILTEGARALQFATERVSARFPGVPIVYGLAFEPVLDFSALPANVTGRHHLLPFAATFEMARALQPDAERVVLVGGTSPNDSLMLATAVRDVTPLVGGMQLVVWQDWTYASLLQSLRRLPPRTITILSSFNARPARAAIQFRRPHRQRHASGVRSGLWDCSQLGRRRRRRRRHDGFRGRRHAHGAAARAGAGSGVR